MILQVITGDTAVDTTGDKGDTAGNTSDTTGVTTGDTGSGVEKWAGPPRAEKLHLHSPQ